MLTFADGKMHYSDTASWVVAGTLPVVLLAALLVPSLEPEGQVARLSLWVLDRMLAFLPLHFPIPIGVQYLEMNCAAARGSVASTRALRVSASLVCGTCVIEAIVAILGRKVLMLAVVLYIGLILLGLGWSAEFVFAMQHGGLVSLLPSGLRHSIEHRSILDLITSGREMGPTVDGQSSSLHPATWIASARTLAPLLLLPREDQEAALALLPLEMSDRLQQPLIESVGMKGWDKGLGCRVWDEGLG